MYQRPQRRCTAMIFAFKYIFFLFRDVAVVVAVLVFLNSLFLPSSAPLSPGRHSLKNKGKGGGAEMQPHSNQQLVYP